MFSSYLKHISIRIWIALLTGGLASLLVLPVLQPRMGLESNLLAAIAILLLFFAAAGWLLNRWALNSAGYLIAEAGAFERDGLYQEAERSFQKAVAVFDSFMMSPAVKRKKAGELGARLARFYLAHSGHFPSSTIFLVSYLKNNPRDEDVAEHWLHQVEVGGGLKEEHQELAASIGDALPGNPLIQSTLARFYLLLERTDYPALQTYRRVCRGDKASAAAIIDDLAGLFLKEGRSDEWALEIYLQALSSNPERAGCLGGLAACVRWTPSTERNQRLLESAHRYLQGFDAETLEKMRIRFNPPGPTETSPATRKKIKPAAGINRAAHAIYHGCAQIVKRLASRFRKAAFLIQHSRKIRRVLAGVLVSGLAVGIGALAMNTVRHLAVNEAPAEKAAAPPKKVISDPFTLQVAAYLKPEYARKYVQELKKQGVDAYWSEAVRGEKKWYQVRVSHFASKQAARDYGQRLKSRGIIDDYYVANYRQP